MASSTSGYATVTLSMSASATSTGHTVSWSLSLADTASSGYIRNETGGASYSVSGGTSTSGNFSFYLTAGNSMTVASGSYTVTHTAATTTSLSASVYTGLSAAGPTISVSASLSLAAIATVSSISLGSSSVAIGGTQTITVTKANSSYTDVLTYSCGGASGTITSSASSGSNSWTIPTAIEAGSSMGSATSATCTVTCTTKNGSTTIGTTSKTFTVTIPSSYKPVITSGTTTIGNGYSSKAYAGYSYFTHTGWKMATNSNGSYVKLKSYTVTLNYGSVSSTTVTSGSATGTTATLTTVTDTMPSATSSYTCKMTVTVTDTRSRSTSSTITLGTVYAYSLPSINITNLYRCDSSGVASATGTYAYISATVSASYSLASGYPHANINSTSYTLSLASGTTYTAIIGGGNLSVSKQYPTYVYAQDAFMSSMSVSAIYAKQTLPAQIVPVSLYDAGTSGGVSLSDVGATFGQVASASGFNVYNDTVTIDNATSFTISQLAGNTMIGNMGGGGSTATVATATWTNVQSFTLGAGDWFADITVGFGSNATGRRTILLSTTSGSASAYLLKLKSSMMAVNGDATNVHLACVFRLSSQTTMYLNVYQNSGTSLSADYRTTLLPIPKYS